MAFIFLYCLLFASLRLLLPQALLPDEASQILDASVYAFGYDKHPPFYSWIVKTVSCFAGINIYSLTLIKYSLLFIFYSSFYLICRNFWNDKNSILITSSLLIFPTYTYSLNYDLTHTILVTMMGSVTLLVFIKLLESKQIKDYISLGFCFGLGLLSKYNYIFILFAIILASLSNKEGRKAILNKYSFITAFITLGLMLPHIYWVIQKKFFSVTYALDEANKDSNFWDIANLLDIAGSYWEVLLYASAVLIVFCPSIKFAKAALNSKAETETIKVIRLVALYALTVPLMVIFVFQLENFCGRWISPIYFTLALAIFSYIFPTSKSKSELEIPRLKFRKTFLVVIALGIITVISSVKLLIALSPNLIGGKSKILIPFDKISQELVQKIKQNNLNLADSLIVVPNRHIGGNIKAQIPEAQIAISYELKQKNIELKNKDLIVISKEKGQEDLLSAPYHNSNKIYKLGLAIQTR